MHIHATKEPTSFLSFLSTRSLTTAHIKVLPKHSAGIYIWRALSIDDFMFVPVFPIYRFWNAFVTFSIHIPALNQSHFEKENYFEFFNENLQNLPPALTKLNCYSSFFLNCGTQQMKINRSWHVSSCAVLLVCVFVHLSVNL